LFVAIILPVGIFTFYQLKSLKKNEEMLVEVQKSQLQTIIFSINQHSDDVMKSLQLRLENILEIPSLTYDDILQKYPGINNVIILKENSEEIVKLSKGSDITDNEIKQINSYYTKVFTKLKEYKDVGFSKLEPLPVFYAASGSYNLLTFIIQDLEGDKSICLVFIKPVIFIEQFLAPKMQELAGDNYVITASDHENGNLVYATDSTENAGLQTLPFWLLPNYDLNVTLKGESAASISERRFKLNLLWTLLLIGILILGFVIIVRNLKREMQLTQLKSDFVSSVSHEIRTPLALINMFAETLLLGRVKDEGKKKEYYEIISKETSRLKNIVNKILNFSQLETNKRSYSFSIVPIDDVVLDTLNTYSYHLDNNGFTHDVAYQAAEALVEIDTEAITEALINLIDNAMKYSGDEKHINIRTGIEENDIFVEVQDFGVGISNKDQKMVFDKFFRVTKGDIYQVRGAGLGLSITKNIVAAHNGRIDLQSLPGHGSTFKLVFPKHQHH